MRFHTKAIPQRYYARKDSNLRLPAPEAGALSTELRARFLIPVWAFLPAMPAEYIIVMSLLWNVNPIGGIPQGGFVAQRGQVRAG